MEQIETDPARKSKRSRAFSVTILILVAVVIADLFIFRFITFRPLGLEPSDLAEGPQLNTWIEAAPAIKVNLAPGEIPELLPALEWQKTTSAGSPEMDVAGFGKRDGDLYVQLRLYESLDFSLKKGWGKAFQLIDSRGRPYLYDSYSLQNGVEISDSFIDLPNDLWARQTVLAGNYRDLYLCFADFPARGIPAKLRIIEAFQGNSPANPGNIFSETRIALAGEMEKRSPLLAGGPDLFSIGPISQTDFPGLDKVGLEVQKLFIDENFLPRLIMEITGPKEREVTFLDGVLVDTKGGNYNPICLEERPLGKEAGSNTGVLEITFERLPAGVELEGLWLSLSDGEVDGELYLEL